MRRLVPEKAVLKEISDLPAKQFRQVVVAIFDLLQEPYPHYSQRLQGSPYWRLAVGEYRVIYRADEESVHLVAFGKRNDGEVYKALSRKM
jgi:mRNA interferase RelE/StbE